MTVVGIDVSKGKSMVAAMKPGGELVAAPYEVRHSDIELSHLALDVLCMEPDTRVVMEATGRYHEPVAALLHSEDGKPKFEKIELQLANGKVFTVVAKNLE